ncbi:hypothetical protein [Kribbella sp. HUAS MG21]|uniref:Uncharacterized protein n=1 Tax=Kribbella sp. HUAS MG21 TaxID=3160966 RepID=A0AAU7TDP6_9ACTN
MNGRCSVQDQPTGETPQQSVERELRAAQEQVRRVAEQLRAGLAEDDRLAADARARATSQTQAAPQVPQAPQVIEQDAADGTKGQH